MAMFLNQLVAKKSSGLKDLAVAIDVENAKEAPFAISYLAKQEGIDLNNFRKPVTTEMPDFDDVPAENVFSDTFCDKYEVTEDKKAWKLIEVAAPESEKNLTDQNDSNEELTIVSAMPQLESRIASIFLFGGETFRITRAQLSDVITLKMDEGAKFFQDIILAVRSEPCIKGANMTQLGALVNGIKDTFPQGDKPTELSVICNFVKQWCSCAVACSVDGHGNDEALANIVTVYRDKKNAPTPAVKTEKANSSFKDANCGIPTIFYAMELDAALSLMGKNPADAKAADVGVAKVLIEKNDPKWRSIVSAFRTIVGITEVERETRHAIIQELLKNLKVIDDKTALLDFIKTRLADHPQCEELAGYMSSNDGEKPEATDVAVDMSETESCRKTVFCLDDILAGPDNNPPAQEPIADIEPEISLSPRALQIKAALQSVINGETDLDSAEAIATTLEGANVDPAYLLEWLPNEIELAELGDELDGGAIGGLMMDLFDIAPKFITDSSERVQFFTNQITLYKKEWAEIEAQNASKEKTAAPKKPTVEELQIRIDQLEARNAKFDLLIAAAVDFLSDIAGRK